MRNRKARACLVAGFAWLVGCGGPETAAGYTVVDIPGYALVTYNSPVAIDDSGPDVKVAGLCPDGSGAATMTGNGETAAWTGSVTCPFIGVLDCARTTITVTSLGGLAATGPATRSVDGRATVVACGVARDALVHYETM